MGHAACWLLRYTPNWFKWWTNNTQNRFDKFFKGGNSLSSYLFLPLHLRSFASDFFFVSVICWYLNTVAISLYRLCFILIHLSYCSLHVFHSLFVCFSLASRPSPQNKIPKKKWTRLKNTQICWFCIAARRKPIDSSFFPSTGTSKNV